MRTLGVKKRLAQEFLGWTLNEADFKSLFAADKKEGSRYHRIYSGDEIRTARLKLARAEGAVRPKELPPLICVRTPKGGAGKTTVISNLGSTLAMMGYKVLLIDGDPQGSLSQIFGLDWIKDNFTHIGTLLRQFGDGMQPDFTGAIRSIYPGVLDLIPGDITMASTDQWLVGRSYREMLVRRMFEANTKWLSQYDVVLIDTAPSTSLLTMALMVAAPSLLVVAQLQPQCIATLDQLVSNIQELEEGGNVRFDVHIVANGLVPPSNPLATLVEGAALSLQSKFPGMIDENALSISPPFVRQLDLVDPEMCGTVIEREPNSGACRQIIDLARSLIGYYGIRLAGTSKVLQEKAA